MRDDNKADPIRDWVDHWVYLRSAQGEGEEPMPTGYHITRDGSLVVDLSGYQPGTEVPRHLVSYLGENARPENFGSFSSNWALEQDDEVIIIGTELGKLIQSLRWKPPAHHPRLEWLAPHPVEIPYRPEDYAVPPEPPLSRWEKVAKRFWRIFGRHVHVRRPAELLPLEDRIAWRQEFFDRNLGI